MWPALFYLSGAAAIAATVLMVTRVNAVHALLYLVLSLIAVALVFFSIGAPFIGILEIVVYAGAIMVLFVFVLMLLNLGEAATATERRWLHGPMWVVPAILAGLLVAEIVAAAGSGFQASGGHGAGPREVSVLLYQKYALGVELASMLLLAGIVGAYHVGWHRQEREVEDADSLGTPVGPGGNPVRTRPGGPPGPA